ncbi:MAG: PKD domain-containing protein [Flavobacteriales bacterium]|nr:PKD domain-containing protein [Flavobacteriales bacterium]
MRSRSFIAVVVLLLLGRFAQAQCPQLYDYYGVPSNNPQWYSCSGTNFTLLIATPQTVGPFTINWGDGTPDHVGASIAPPQTVSHVYPATVGTYTITFTVVATGCTTVGTLTMEQSTSASIQIPVGGLTQVCAPHAVEFINSSTNVSPNTVFVWNFGDGSPNLTFDHTNLGQTISHTYQQGTVDCETTVSLTAQNTCNTLQGGASLATFNPIRIWDIDDAAITPSATLLCWPDNQVTYLNTTNRNCLMQGNIFQRYEYWNFGDYWGTGQDSIIDWTPWPPTFPRTIAYPGIGTYEVMMLDSNYCGIDTAFIQITIVPPPSVTLTAAPTTICAGETVNFIQTTDGGANYFQWNFGTGNGFQWTGAGNQSFTYNTPGTYTVSYTASIQGATAGCADTASVVITVLPSPTAAFDVDNDAACYALTVAFTNTSTPGQSYLWNFGDGTTSTLADPPPHDYTTAGSYTISLTVTNGQGCSSVATQVVNVFDPPGVGIQVQNLCIGQTAQFTPVITTAPGNEAIQWEWDLGDGNTSSDESPGHQYATAGTYVVTLTVTTPYCGNTGTQWISVQAQPTAVMEPTPTLGCSPMNVFFGNASTGATNYLWEFGDGMSTTEEAPTHTYINPGTSDVVYTVTLTASTPFGCSNITTSTITVAPGVQAAFTHNGMPGCAPLDVAFNNTSTGATSYFWDFGDGNTSTAAQPQHVYVNNTYSLQVNTVTLTATSSAGCTSTVSAQVTVYPLPNFSFVAEPDSGCSPLTVTLPSVIGAVLYQWDFGDGTTGTGPSPTHIFVNNDADAAVYPISLVATNAFGCSGSATASVTVFPLPTAQIALSGTEGCHPLTVQLSDLSTGAVQSTWNYGDGQSASNAGAVHEHTWYNFAGPATSTFPISLTATSVHGCTSVSQAQVQVHPAVTAAFVAPDTICSPLLASFINTSTGANGYQWFFGDGQFSSQASPAHAYQAQGLNDVAYQAMLVASNAYGCTDTARAPILVHPQPLAQFLTNTQAGCQPLQVNFQDLSIGATQLAWSFGDGQSLLAAPGNTTHSYVSSAPDPVTFSAQLVAISQHGCTDTTERTIEVYPQVLAAFTLDTLACSPLPVSISNQSIGASSYLWTMGDGNILVGDEPTYTYVNTTNGDQVYTITLTATSPYGCTSVATQNVYVYPVPSAAFQATPFQQQFPNSTVNITNNSGPGAWWYQWNYGDGTTSTSQLPGSHTYSTWGQYTITLVVGGTYCTSTVTQTVEIIPPLPTASFLGQGAGCAPLTVSFTNTSLQGLSYQWNFGDGGTSTADNPTYIYNVPGTYTVTLTAFGVGGGVNVFTKVDSVVVHPRANAYFVLQPEEVVVPSQPVFTYNLSSNATSYQWDFGDGATYTSLNPVHYYTSAGSYDVMLIANNQWNCPDTFRVESAVTGKVSGQIQFPNAFTPTSSGPGDGSYDPRSYDNDVFFPIYEGVEDYRLEIFNRWGELLFVSHEVQRGWDGWYRGHPAKQDVYVWKCYAKFSDGREAVLKGDVTLLR